MLYVRVGDARLRGVPRRRARSRALHLLTKVRDSVQTDCVLAYTRSALRTSATAAPGWGARMCRTRREERCRRGRYRVTFQRPIGIPMTNEETTHQISNGIHSTNPLDFQWPTTHWKSNGPLDIQWGIGNPMGHPIGFPMGAKIEIVNLW